MIIENKNAPPKITEYTFQEFKKYKGGKDEKG
jgi:hypothetical protein